MASGPITTWQIKGEKVEAVTEFPLLGLQNHCRQWLQPWNQKMIASWQESNDKPRQCVEKQKHYSANKGLQSRLVFPVVTYGCESWTIKKAEHQRIDAFKLWCWRRLLKVPWTERSNQSILREINPEYSLEGLMLRLKLHYFDHLIWSDDSLEKSLMLGKIEGRRRRGHQKMRQLDGFMGQWTWTWANSRKWGGIGRPGELQSVGSQRVKYDWVTE